MSQSVVFIHGILSSCERCFPDMKASIETDERFSEWKLYWFNYDYNQPIRQSANDLSEWMQSLDYDSAMLVGHSMGGLVARMGILSGKLRNIRKLIMLGTPNFGACRTSRSALLMQVALLTAGHVSSIFRKPGILELTRVTDVMAEPVQTGAHFADEVDYATVAGTFFNESRGVLDIGQSREWSASGMLFKAVQVGVELSALVPLWRPAIERPHDGIVEEHSCALVPSGPGRASEKTATINHPRQFGQTYAHIFHDACDDLMHVTLQGNDKVIDLVKGLLLAESLTDWKNSVDRELARHIKVLPEGFI